MTKEKYIQQHPKSYLTKNLINNNWSNKQKIVIIGGKIAAHNKQSNLYAALQKSMLHEYVIGGRRQNRSEGYWIAVA